MAFSLRAIRWTVLANLGIQASAIVSGVVIARLLGPEGRGHYAAVLLYPNLIAAFAAWGFGPVLARRIAAAPDPAARKKAVSLAWMAAALGAFPALAMVAAVYFAGLPHPAEDGTDLGRMAALYGACWIPLNLFGVFLLALDQGEARWARYSAYRVMVNPIYIASLAGLWYFGAFTLANVFWTLLAANFIAVAVRVINSFREHGLPRASVAEYRALAAEARPYAMAQYSTVALTQLDQFLAVNLLSYAQTGYFNVALTVAQLLAPISGALGQVAFTDAAQGRSAVELYATRFRLIGAGYVVFAALLACAIPYLVPLIYGAKFTDASMIALWMLPGGVAAGLGSILDESLRGKGRPEFGMKSRWAAAAMSALIAALLAGQYGATALAIGFSIGNLVRTLVLMRAYAKLEGTGLAEFFVPRMSDLAQLRHLRRRPKAKAVDGAAAPGDAS